MNAGNRDNSVRDGAAALVQPHIAAMSGYVPGEQPSGGPVIKLNTNENPYPPSSAVRTAITEACENLLLYPDPTAREVREAAAGLYDVDPDGVLVGNGSDELLSVLVRATTAPGEGIAYPVPTYSLYDTLVVLQGAQPRCMPWGPGGTLPAELREVDARLFFLCNPNAPTGTLLPEEDLADFAEQRSDAVVVIDEAYVDFADHSCVGLVRRRSNVVVLRTLSKSYSLAGLRVGLALTSPGLAAQLHKVRDSYNVSRIAQAGALAALRDQATMRQQVQQVRATRERLTSRLRDLGFVVDPSHANFVLARRPGEDVSGLADALRKRRILVRYFPSIPEALRISVGTDAEIDELFKALDAILV